MLFSTTTLLPNVNYNNHTDGATTGNTTLPYHTTVSNIPRISPQAHPPQHRYSEYHLACSTRTTRGRGNTMRGSILSWVILCMYIRGNTMCYVCQYVCIYIYIYTHTHIYIYIAHKYSYLCMIFPKGHLRTLSCP